MSLSVSPISKLDSDALLTIIDLITCRIPIYYSTDRPMGVVRAASQVCRRWREVIIGSPWIWGRLIDLGVKGENLRRCEWMEEIISRSGSAPLWIYGTRTQHSRESDQTAFLIRILDLWEHVQKLSVRIWCTDIRHYIQSRLLSPAPILRVFDVLLHDVPNPLFSNPSQRLFSDNAPLLEEIRTDHVSIKAGSPWLSGIRRLEIMSPKVNRLDDIFQLLHSTPLLEEFIVVPRYSRSVPEHPPIPSTLKLPRLSSIRILHSNLDSTARILSHIIPDKLSFCKIGIEDRLTTMINHHITSSFEQSLPSYIASYITSSQGTELHFHLSGHFFHFRDVLPTTLTDSKGILISSGFDIRIEDSLRDNDSRDTLMMCLLGAFVQVSKIKANASPFNLITSITLNFWDRLTDLTTKALRSMLKVFHNIEYLRVDEHSFENLWAISCPDTAPDGTGHHIQPIFPKLRTVYIDTRVQQVQRVPLSSQRFTGLTEFLLHRSKIGFPVATFELTTFWRWRYAEDLSALEEVPGLEIVWKRFNERGDNGQGESLQFQVFRYVCGTGDPQRLKELWTECTKDLEALDRR